MSKNEEWISAKDIETAVQKIVPYLKDTRYDATKATYFDGWNTLGASAVLRAIAEHPPPSLWEKFDKIIHIDCSRWKSQRALQRAIADELKLTQQVASEFYAQDEEDDFSGVDQGSRAEIRGVARAIARSVSQYRCLVVLHNGSNGMVDLLSCGIPQPELFGTKVLWTLRGWLRCSRGISEKVPSSHLNVRCFGVSEDIHKAILEEEAREIALYTHKLGHGMTPEIVTECCLYILSLIRRGTNDVELNWATHASSYWVCDGIVQGGQDNQAWELARALQQQIRLEDYYSSSRFYDIDCEFDSSTKHWIYVVNYHDFKQVPPRTTSLFFVPTEECGTTPLSFAPTGECRTRIFGPTDDIYYELLEINVSSLPDDRFHGADQLRVLKLCRCTFSFKSPPFHCCHNLRFLALDNCMDERQCGEEKHIGTRTPAVEIFQRLWVLDVCHTDWELDFPLETEDPVVATCIREVHINKGRIWRADWVLDFPVETEEPVVATDIIREVHINKGKIWRSNLAWRRLPNLVRLRVVEPTSSWETERKDDEFMDMVKLELLDLSRNSTIQVLPSLSGAASLRTLVLDDKDDPEKKNAKVSSISLAGCARLVDFRLQGPLPKLEELDLSHTALKMLDLEKVEQAGNLERVLLMGCKHLCSISWPKWDLFRHHRVRLLCIDTRAAGEVATKPLSSDSLMGCEGEEDDDMYAYYRAFVAVADMRFLQSLMPICDTNTRMLNLRYLIFKWNLCFSSNIKEDDDGRSRRLATASPLPKSLAYHDINTEQQMMTTQIDHAACSSATRQLFQPQHFHMEIGEGVSDVPNTVSEQGRKAIEKVMNTMVESLHVHDSSSITAVTPGHIFLSLSSKHFGGITRRLKWCRVERCPELDTVFVTYCNDDFVKLETFWAAHLLMARSIWSTPETTSWNCYMKSFMALRAIHLHFCPGLRYVLALVPNFGLSNQLETLDVLCCGDLRQVFPVEEEFIKEIAAGSHRNDKWEWNYRKGMLEFPKLKNLYLHDLPSLQLICEAKMFAPNLETIYIRGCWGLRRLPATDSHRLPVAVDCEKDFWDKLEWDGMESGHHPSLFQPRHSKYYRKRHLRGTVLR